MATPSDEGNRILRRLGQWVFQAYFAVGTTAVRALEGQAARNGGRLVGGGGVTDLIVDASHRPRVVDGLLTGLHEPGSSHFELLKAFAAPDLLYAAHAHAEAAGYLAHEFGDCSLILRG